MSPNFLAPAPANSTSKQQLRLSCGPSPPFPAEVLVGLIRYGQTDGPLVECPESEEARNTGGGALCGHGERQYLFSLLQ